MARWSGWVWAIAFLGWIAYNIPLEFSKETTMAQFLTYNEQQLSIGDTIRVHQEISENGKTRIQVFEGILIAIKNRGTGKSFTVRKVAANNVGVEKIFPAQLPSIKKIELKRQGTVRRAKLYYLRDRIGKAATRIKEKTTVREAVAAA